jgi:TolA-binding protein
MAPLSNTAIHSTYFEGIVLYREERWDEARRVFEELLERFPEAQAAAEAMYHIGLCAERTGDAARAARAFEATQQGYPGTTWATLAGERLEQRLKRP